MIKFDKKPKITKNSVLGYINYFLSDIESSLKKQPKNDYLKGKKCAFLELYTKIDKTYLSQK